MQFNYVAYTLRDGVFKGAIEAESEAEARSEVIRLGYRILQLKAKWQPPGLEQMFPSMFRVRTGELVRFSRQLAVMVRGGSSLQRALELLQNESNNRVMRRVLGVVRKTLDEGGSLSGGLAKHPDVFPPRYTSVVESGEYTGSLAPALDQLADSLEKEQEAIQRAKRTLMMPAFTMVISVIMLFMMLTFMMPKLLKTFEDLGSDVPAMTRIALGLIGALTGNLVPIFAVIGGLIAVVSLGRRLPSFKYAMHVLQTRLPVVGSLVVVKELAQFSRTIAMLLGSGVGLAIALPLATSGTKNLAMHRAFAAGEDSLLTGHGLAEALREYPVLPRMWVELVLIGEESNSLGRTMTELADAYDKELENRIGGLVGILEPLSTLGVGAVVLFMALSTLLPIFSSLEAVGGG